MELLVVDTDVASYIFKADTRARRYLKYLTNHKLIMSFMTLSELKWWALKHNWGENRQQRLREYLLQNYVFYFSDEELCNIWAEVYEFSHRNGKSMSRSDAWIAATALVLEAPLITNNRKDFDHIPNLNIVPIN